MSKKILAIDIDDVIADSMNAMRTLINEHVGVELTEADYRLPGDYWSYHEEVWERHGIKDKVDYELIDNFMLSSQIKLLYPKSDAVDNLQKLSKIYDIVLVTARDPRYFNETERWLDAHVGKLHKDLHVIGNHRTTKNPRSKGEICREIGASWLIDDNPQHCVSALEHGSDAILFGEYGWHHEAPAHLKVGKNWNDVSVILS